MTLSKKPEIRELSMEFARRQYRGAFCGIPMKLPRKMVTLQSVEFPPKIMFFCGQLSGRSLYPPG